jgi:hypothetical protein
VRFVRSSISLAQWGIRINQHIGSSGKCGSAQSGLGQVKAASHCNQIRQCRGPSTWHLHLGLTAEVLRLPNGYASCTGARRPSRFNNEPRPLTVEIVSGRPRRKCKTQASRQVAGGHPTAYSVIQLGASDSGLAPLNWLEVSRYCIGAHAAGFAHS